jgi:hypothetical protein
LIVQSLDATQTSKFALQNGDLPDYGYLFIKIVVSNIPSPVDNKSQVLVYGDTVVFDTVSNEVLNLTVDIPTYTAWPTQLAEECRNRDMKAMLYDRCQQHKYPHPSMAKLLLEADTPDVTVLFGLGPITADIIGKSSIMFFEQGLVLKTKRLGITSIPFEHNLIRVTGLSDSSDAIVGVLLEISPNKIPSKGVSYFANHNSVLLVFNQNRPVRGKFVLDVLPQWKTYCEMASIPYSTDKLGNTPNHFTFELENVKIAHTLKQKEMEASQQVKKPLAKLSLAGTSQPTITSNLFQDRSHWKHVLHNVLQIRDAQFDVFGGEKKQEDLTRSLAHINDRYEAPTNSIPLHIIAGGPSIDKVHVANQLLKSTEEDRYKSWKWSVVNPDAFKVRLVEYY